MSSAAHHLSCPSAGTQPHGSLKEEAVSYVTKRSSRLDILEDRRSDMGAICVYDFKTVMEGLTLRRLARIGRLVTSVFPGAAAFYVTQVGPMAGGGASR